MESELRVHLFTVASAFAVAKGLGQSTVGRVATGDSRFFDRIERGASFTARKYDATMAWFSENWPADAAWPVDVPRPAPTEAAA